MEKPSQTQKIVDIAIKLGLLAIIIGWCGMLLFPFTSILLWAIILAIAFNPLYVFLLIRLGKRRKLSASLIVVAALLIIAIPSWLFLDSVLHSVSILREEFEAGALQIPEPDDKIASWPLIGNSLYNFWVEASNNLESILVRFQTQIMDAANFFLKQIMGIGGSIIQMIAATIIAGVLLVTQGAEQTMRLLLIRILGDKGNEFADIIQKTVINVVKGVIGVAFIQSILVGIGLIIAGVPYAGLWSLVILILVILQLPAAIVVIPVIIYMFATHNPIPAILWSIFFLIAGAIDNVLKPIILGKGAPVPMLIIFLGVLGGFIVSGFIGLFTGAIVLSIGYTLFSSWLSSEASTSDEDRSAK